MTIAVNRNLSNCDGYFRNFLNCDSLRWPHTHFILMNQTKDFELIKICFLKSRPSQIWFPFKHVREQFCSVGAIWLVRSILVTFQPLENETFQVKPVVIIKYYLIGFVLSFLVTKNKKTTIVFSVSHFRYFQNKCI